MDVKLMVWSWAVKKFMSLIASKTVSPADHPDLYTHIRWQEEESWRIWNLTEHVVHREGEFELEFFQTRQLKIVAHVNCRHGLDDGSILRFVPKLNIACVRNTSYAIGATVESTGASKVGFGGWRIKLPKRGGVDREINSIFVGSFAAAWRRTVPMVKQSKVWKRMDVLSLASSSRIGTPPISNMTRPIGTLRRKCQMACKSWREKDGPGCPIFKCSFTFAHTSFTTLRQVVTTRTQMILKYIWPLCKQGCQGKLWGKPLIPSIHGPSVLSLPQPWQVAWP